MYRSVSLIAIIVLSHSQSPAQHLDGSWIITVNGQVTQANADGSFYVPNVAVADVQPVDFRPDEPVRVVAVSTAGGRTRYAYTDLFDIRRGEVVLVPELVFTDIPAPLPETIRIALEPPSERVLTATGQTTRLTVLAKLVSAIPGCAASVECDVTAPELWTTYRSSNPSIATVDRSGVVTAGSKGIALISARNGGATATARIVISPGDALGTVEGFVTLPGGNPASGALVAVRDQAREARTDASGMFVLENLATALGRLVLNAEHSVGGLRFEGRSEPLRLDSGGVTDAGVIFLTQATDHVYPFAVYDFEGDAKDVSGNGRDGEIRGPVFVEGIQGQGLSFDGIDDLVQLPININPGAMPQLTMGLWVKPQDVTGRIQQLLSHDNGGYDRSLDIDVRQGTAPPPAARVSRYSAFGGATRGVVPGADALQGEWTFAAVTYDGPSGAIALYLNQDVFTAMGRPAGGGNTFVHVGHNPGGFNEGEFFRGVLDNVFLFDRVLTPEQMATIAASNQLPISTRN